MEAQTAALSSSTSVNHRFRRAVRWVGQAPFWFTLPLCLAVLVARMPDSFQNPQFWAEDGTEFYHDGYALGLHALFKSYVGYYHFVPRLVAAISAWFDPHWAPRIFVGLAAALTLYVAALTQSPRFPFRRHLGFALAVVMIPDAGETLLKLVNIQWILAGGLLLLLIMRDPEGWVARCHDAIAVVVIGLTGPFSILFSPLFLIRACWRRTRFSVVLAMLVIACAAAQAWEIHRWNAPPVEHPIPASGWGRITGMRVAGSLFAGYKVPGDYSAGVEVALGLMTLALVAVLSGRKGEHRAERIALGLGFVLVTAAAIYRVRHVPLPAMCNAGNGSRYFYLPQLIVLWLLLAVALEPRRMLAWAGTFLLVVATAMNLPRMHQGEALPDLHWDSYAPKIRAGEAVDATVNPGWVIHLPAKPAPPK